MIVTTGSTVHVRAQEHCTPDIQGGYFSYYDNLEIPDSSIAFSSTTVDIVVDRHGRHIFYCDLDADIYPSFRFNTILGLDLN